MWQKVLLLFFVFSFLFKTDHSFDQDLGRHLTLGELIWNAKSVPTTNLFSYSNPNFPFINTHWLFEVWAYLTSKALGLQVLLFIKLLIILCAVWLTLKNIPKKSSFLLLPVGFIFLHVLRERTELRPEIFSFLFTALIYLILEVNLQKATKWIYLIPFMQLVWINTHIYFFIGLLLQAIYIIYYLYKYLYVHPKGGDIKLSFMILILSVLVSLINPNFLTGFLYPLNVTKNYGYTIVENQTMFYLENLGFKDPNFLFVKISIIIIFISLITAFLKKRFEIKNILLAGLGITLALLNVRSLPYLVFLSLPATLINFGQFKQNTLTKILILIFGFLVVLESYYYLNGEYYLFNESDNKPTLQFVSSAQKAMDFVIGNNLPEPIYNNFDIGSYIIYRGYPKYKPFVDGRPEAYPKNFFTDIYIPTQYDYSKFQNLQKRYAFKTIIFSHTDQTPWGKAFLNSVVKDNNWKIVYIDDFMIVFTVSDSKYKSLDLSVIDPSSYEFNSHISYLRLALFLAQSQNLQPAQKFAQKGLSLFPQSPLGNALFGINVNKSFFW